MNLFPFDTVREAQGQMMKDIEASLSESGSILIHAPTGIGKTAAALTPVLNWAIEHKKTVLFLTPRHTQHQIVVDTIKKMNSTTGSDIKVVDLIGKKWMCKIEGIETLSSSEFSEFCNDLKTDERCEFYNAVYKNGEITEKARKFLKSASGAMHSEELMSSCTGFCPYEIAILMAKDAQVIVADYYHFFHPQVRKSLLTKLNKNISDFVVIIDEAHNLPGRVKELMTFTTDSKRLEWAIREARKFKLPCDEDLVWVQQALKDLAPEKEELITREDFISKVEDYTQKNMPDLIDELSGFGESVRKEQRRSSIGALSNFLDGWCEEREGYVRIIKRGFDDGKERITLTYLCLDPSVYTKEVFDEAPAVLMSGTLTPLTMYKDILGFDKANLREYVNPFPVENRLVIVVPETTTRYSKRNQKMYASIGYYLSKITKTVKSKSAIFFPSYFLRDEINKYVTSDKEVILEERKDSKKDKLFKLNKFRNSLLPGVLMGVISGSFSEGIDFPGKALEVITIVGIPLEKPDLETKSLIKYYDDKFGEGWNYGYIYPAINRILQAAGRAIRSKSDKGAIILLDERYMWSSYRKCLPTDWQIKITKEPWNLLSTFFGYPKLDLQEAREQDQQSDKEL